MYEFFDLGDQPVYRRLAFSQYPGSSAALAVLAVALLIVAPLLSLGSGLVLGPLIVILTWAFLEIWRRRTAYRQDATEAIATNIR